MGFMETFLMRQLGKLVEIVRHANEILGDGYRLSVVSTDHLAVQGGLTDVLRQLAVLLILFIHFASKKYCINGNFLRRLVFVSTLASYD